MKLNRHLLDGLSLYSGADLRFSRGGGGADFQKTFVKLDLFLG